MIRPPVADTDPLLTVDFEARRKRLKAMHPEFYGYIAFIEERNAAPVSVPEPPLTPQPGDRVRLTRCSEGTLTQPAGGSVHWWYVGGVAYAKELWDVKVLERPERLIPGAHYMDAEGCCADYDPTDAARPWCREDPYRWPDSFMVRPLRRFHFTDEDT